MEPTTPRPKDRAPFRLTVGNGQIVATAIHAGHDLRPEVARIVALSAAERLREEDPYTDRLTIPFTTAVVVDRSRFEVDLNRHADEAVYQTPAQAWGLEVWTDRPDEDLVARSRAIHADFYRSIDRLLDDLAAKGPFVVLDLHSYNHRRGGPHAAPEPIEDNPDVNLGTGTLDRGAWGSLVDRFAADLMEGLPPSVLVAENVKFEGGHLSRHVNESYPDRGCAIALEFKKTFMDEWTGEPDEAAILRLIGALEGTRAGLECELEARR